MPGLFRKKPTPNQTGCALASGDERAFDHLFRTYFPSLVFFASRIIQDNAAAQDVVQDVFVRLWNKRTECHHITDPGGYLYIMVRNRCSDFLWAARRVEKNAVDVTIPEQNEEEDHEMIVAETIRMVLAAMDELPPRMQEVFRQYYLEEKSTRDISYSMQTSTSTVDNQRQAALKHIRERIIPNWKARFEK